MRPLLVAGFAFALLFAVVSGAPAGLLSAHGPDPGATGAPEIGGLPAEFDCSLCHEGNPVNGPAGAVEILGLPSAYVPGANYPLTVRLNSTATAAFAGRRWGFELGAVREGDGAAGGSFLLTDPTTVQVVSGSTPFRTRLYVEHTFAGTHDGEAGPVEWSFTWQAPAAPEGTIHFSCAAVAANGTTGPDGDFVYTRRDSSSAPGTTGVPGAPAIAIRLAAPAPNPSPGAVSFAFTLGEAGDVRLAIHDVRGRLVRRVVSGWRDAGPGGARWDGRRDDGAAAPAGVYQVRLSVAGKAPATATRSFVLTR